MLYFQLVIMAGTVLLAYYFECTDTFQVHIQGFFCQDGNLMKPYPGTEEASFISPLVLYCVLAATPTAIVSSFKAFLIIHMIYWAHNYFIQIHFYSYGYELKTYQIFWMLNKNNYRADFIVCIVTLGFCTLISYNKLFMNGV